jgi:hypothetical protein
MKGEMRNEIFTPVVGGTGRDNFRNGKKVDNLINEIGKYRRKWEEHLKRMTPHCVPRAIMEQRPRG